MDPNAVTPIVTPPQQTPEVPRLDPEPNPFQSQTIPSPQSMPAEHPVMSPPTAPPPPQPTQPIAPPQPITPQPTIPPAPLPVENVMSGGSSGKKRLGGFGVFVIIAIVILLGVWGVVGYLYLGNKNKEPEPVNQETAAPTPTEIPFNPNEIQISNGDVVRQSSAGETQTLVKKDDYPATGLIGFARVVVSPDNTKLCFESIPPAPDPAIYLSNVDGSSVEQVVKNKHNCTWSPDNNFLFYVNDPLGNKQLDIFAYSLTSKEERNLTEKTSTPTALRQYTIGQISGNTLSCSYDVVNASAKKVSSSNCSIDLISGEVTDAP